MRTPDSMPTPQELLQAEHLLIREVHSRLARRYLSRYPAPEADTLARSITGILFAGGPLSEQGQHLLGVQDHPVTRELALLQEDEEIRRAASDTAVLKAVFLSRRAGCRGAQASTAAVDLLRQLGLFREGFRPPTPRSYVRMAQAFSEAAD